MDFKENRIEFFDVLRGGLAVCVVLGHVIVAYDINAFNNIIFKICYSFHMYLFMFVSGWLIAHKKITIEWLIKNRSKRLLIPYIVWTAFSFISGRDYGFSLFVDRLFLNPYWWYLIVLFLCDVILLSTKIGKTNKASLLIAIVWVFILNIVYVLPINVCETFKMTAIFFPYYYAGYYLSHNNWKMKPVVRNIGCVLYPISMIFFTYKDNTIQIELIKKILQFIKLNNEIIEKIVLLMDKAGLVMYSHFIVPVLGCIFFWNLGLKLTQYKYIRKIFGLLGKYSLQIYILSGFFSFPISSNIIGNEIFSLSFGIIMSVIIATMISKAKPLNRFLFGS